jgi:hypothetical protein
MNRLLLCAALLAWPMLASAVVYKWVDAQGKVQYGDRPPDGVHAELVEGLGTSHGTQQVAASAPRPSPSPPTLGNAAPAPSEKEKKAVDQDVEATRQKQCAEAQDRYKKLIEGRHLYITGENGEKQFLTSEQIDTERLNAKRDVDSLCDAG